MLRLAAAHALSSVSSALLQCRVEGNPQNRMQFRVTVAAPDPALASSVKDMVAAQIMAMP
jgi:hypothetical protein